MTPLPQSSLAKSWARWHSERPCAEALLWRCYRIEGVRPSNILACLIEAPPENYLLLGELSRRAAGESDDLTRRVQSARKRDARWLALLGSARWSLAVAAVARYLATGAGFDRQWAEWVLAAVEAPHGIGHAWEKEARE